MKDTDFLKKSIITIDGPSGSGKTTTAKRVAEGLELTHIDTGAMYRAVTLRALQQGADLDDSELLGTMAMESRITFEEGEQQRVLLDGADVTRAIRTPEVTGNVSLVSSHPQVRRVMGSLQRRLAEAGGVVLEGRDIGSVILPHAQVKIYLVASIDVRAQRRHREMSAAGMSQDIGQIRADIAARDEFDSGRKMSPLRQPVGSVQIDTSALTIDEQVEQVIACARETAEYLAKLAAPTPSRHPALIIRPDYRIAQACLRSLWKMLFGLKIHRHTFPVFNENYIFACNHLSYTDPPLVGSTLGRELFFIAKRELFSFPPFAWLIRRYNAIPLTRGTYDKKAMDTALHHLRNHRSMMIFPEGTRQRSGRLGKPRSGVGYLAVNTGVPTIPVYVEGSNSLKRAIFRATPLRVVIGQPIRMSHRCGSEYQNNESYRAYSDMVMAAISALKDSLHERGPLET